MSGARSAERGCRMVTTGGRESTNSPRSSRRPRWRRAARAAALAAMLLGLWPGVLAAHTELRWSRPADGETLAASPAEVRLRFTTPVEPRYTRLSLFAADGAELALPALVGAEGSREFHVVLAAPLPPGVYTVQWRTTAADGHLIEGAFAFTVEGEPARPDTAASPPSAPLAGAGPPAAPLAPSPAEGGGLADPRGPLGVALRFLHFVALLGLIGAAVFRLGVLGWLADSPHALAGGEQAAARTRTLARAAFALLVPTIVGRLWMQSAALHGPGAAWSPDDLRTLVGATAWGRAWLLQVGAAAVTGAGLLLARRAANPTRGWPIVLPGVLGLAAVPALSGHAAAVDGAAWAAVLNDTFHVLGAGAWLGTLALLLLAGLPAALRAPADERAGAVATLVDRFSLVALAAASLVVVTGVVNALFHVGTPADLWGTPYGRVLLLKLLALLPVVGLGAYNWRVVRPALRADGGESPEGGAWRLQRSAGIEIGLGVLVVLLTAVLVATPPA